MVWLPDGEKILKICLFVLTEFTNVTDRHTQTLHDDISHASVASHGKNRDSRRRQEFRMGSSIKDVRKN